MLERVKWLTIMIMIAGMVMGAQAAFERFIYLPTSDIVPASTPTSAPSASPVPTQIPTLVKTQLPPSGVTIVNIISAPAGDELNGEYVQIENTLDDPVEISGWSLRDDQKNVYTFPTCILQSGQSVSVWSRTGVDTTANLYWNLDAETWNNGGDCAYLRDASGKLQSYVCY